MAESFLEDLQRQGYAVHTWSNGPDFWYPVHDHPYSKVIVVLKGSVVFYMPGEKREVPLKAGQRLELAPHTEHSATVGPEGVTCLEGQR